MSEVRTRDEAIVSVDQALGAWSTGMKGVLDQAQAVVSAAKAEIERVVGQRATVVAAVEALIAGADERDRRRLEAELVRAREAHEQARRASVRVSDVLAGVSQLTRSHKTTAVGHLGRAHAELSAMSSALEDYRSAGSGGLGGGSVGAATRSGTGNSISNMGLTDVSVGSADLAENPILDDGGARGAFGKGGLSRADYRWAVQTWNDTVGPGVAAGKTRDDFAARDAQSDAKPLRQTAAVYDMFLGTDRIRADRRADGSLNVVNGRHRLLIARELGIKSLPGEVS